MSTAVVKREPKQVQQLNAIRIDSIITYPVTTEMIAELKTKYADLNADTPKGFEECKLARAKVRSLRTEVEKQREILKAPILKEGKRIDAAAKGYESGLLEIEEPLDKKIKAVEARKEAERKAKEDEERRKVEDDLKERAEAHERKLREEREAEEARLKAERERLAAERKKMDEEKAAAEEQKRIEQARLDAERSRLAEEASRRQEKIEAEQRAEREKLEAEKRKIEQEKRQLEADRITAERKEFERQAKLKAEQEAKEKAEAERVAAEQEKERKAAAEAAELKRQEALKPDIEKVYGVMLNINALIHGLPSLASVDGAEMISAIRSDLQKIADETNKFLNENNFIPY